MTENDKQLIKNANHLYCVDWYLADKMVEKADTEEAKKQLQDIAKRLYHKEEYLADLL